MAFDSSDGSPRRRSYLKLLGSTAATPFLSRAAAAGDGDRYNRVVDVVEEGADDSGEEPIDGVVGEHERDGTLLEFPEGRYRVDDLNFYGRERFGLRATGDATLVPGDYEDSPAWIAGSGMNEFLFEGFTLDHTAADTAPTVCFYADNGLEVRDVTKRGRHDGEDTAFGFGATDPDGTALIEGLQMPDGSIPEKPVGVYVQGEGTVTFRECHVEGFGNNGLYASMADGPVHVEGGLFRNNDRSNVRLGSSGSSVRNATIEVTRAREADKNLRGVRISDGPGPVTVDGCTVNMLGGHGMGGIVHAYNAGSLEVRDTRIAVANEYRNFNDTRTGYAVMVQEDSSAATGTRRFENVRIVGDAWDGPTVSIRRDDATFYECCIDHGRKRDGIGFHNTPDDVVVEESTIDVAGEAFVGEADLETRNVSYSGGCSGD